MQQAKEFEVEDEDKVDLTKAENIDVVEATLELTHRSNVFRNNSPVTEKVPESEELSTAEWQRVIDKLADNGVEKVYLSGEEPTLRDDFHDILGYAINVVGEVTVVTNGCTSTPLSTYDCSVHVRIDSLNPSFHNRIFRSTDPDRYKIDGQNNRLVDTKGGDCTFCGQYCKNVNGSRLHLKNNHQQEAIEMFNDGVRDTSVSEVNSWDNLREKIGELEAFSWRLYLENVKDVSEENALGKAIGKIKKLENEDVVIRANIYEENDVELIMTFAEKEGVDTVFTPLRPSGKAKDNFEHQVPTPRRMMEVMGKVIDIDSILSTSHAIDSPIYTAYQYKRARQLIDGDQSSAADVESLYEVESELERFWNRGRVTDVGVSKLCVSAEGKMMPAPYLRRGEYTFGDILDCEWADVEEGLCEFNEIICSDDRFTRPAINTDLRRKSVACDYGVALNYGYEE